MDVFTLGFFRNKSPTILLFFHKNRRPRVCPNYRFFQIFLNAEAANVRLKGQQVLFLEKLLGID